MHYPTAWINNENNPFPLGDDKRFIESPTDYVDTWKALEKIAKSHRALSIGVSNFNSYQIKRLVGEALILPVTNQIEVNPYLTNEDVIQTCLDYGITVTAYSPLGNPSKPQVVDEDFCLFCSPKIWTFFKLLSENQIIFFRLGNGQKMTRF